MSEEKANYMQEVRDHTHPEDKEAPCDHMLKYCAKCDVVWCEKCKREWGAPVKFNWNRYVPPQNPNPHFITCAHVTP